MIVNTGGFEHFSLAPCVEKLVLVVDAHAKPRKNVTHSLLGPRHFDQHLPDHRVKSRGEIAKNGSSAKAFLRRAREKLPNPVTCIIGATAW